MAGARDPTSHTYACGRELSRLGIGSLRIEGTVKTELFAGTRCRLVSQYFSSALVRKVVVHHPSNLMSGYN